MARPVKNNADYFSHDADMRNDPKIKALRTKFGHMGYAVWCFLLEVMTDAEYFEIEWDELNIELLSGDFGVTSDELMEVVDYCGKIKLFQMVGGKLTSDTLKKRFEQLTAKRDKRRGVVMDVQNPPISAISGVSDVQNPKVEPKQGVSDVQNTQSKVKESKGNKSKLKEIKENISLYGEISREEREIFFEILFFEKKIFAPPEYERFVNHYAKTGWTDSNGNPIVDRVAALKNWKVAADAVKVPTAFHNIWKAIYSVVKYKYPDSDYIALLAELYNCSAETEKINIFCSKNVPQIIESPEIIETVKSVREELFPSKNLRYILN